MQCKVDKFDKRLAAIKYVGGWDNFLNSQILKMNRKIKNNLMVCNLRCNKIDKFLNHLNFKYTYTSDENINKSFFVWIDFLN